MSGGNTLKKWKIFCNEEKLTRYVWKDDSEPAPTTCPVDTGHSVNLASVSVVDTRASDEVRIKEVDTLQDGRFYSDSIDFVARGPTGTTTEHTFSYPTPVSIAVGDWIGRQEDHGDIISIVVAPNMTVGAIGFFVGDGDTGFPCAPPQLPGQPRATDVLRVGAFVRLYDGVRASSEVEITALDRVNDAVRVSPPLDTGGHTFSPLTPTYIQMSSYMVNKRMLSHAAHLELGKSLIGGSDIPANLPIVIRYTNNMPMCTIGRCLADVESGATRIVVNQEIYIHRLAPFNTYVCIEDDEGNVSVETKIQRWDVSCLPENAKMIVDPPIDLAFPLSRNPVVRLTGSKHVVFATEGKKGTL